MGCLLEFFGELFFELILHCYIELMRLIVPSKTFSEKAKRKMRKIATVIAALLVVVLIVGLIFLLQADPLIKTIGKYMTYIPLAIIVLQISAGIIVKIVEHFIK